MGKIWSVINNLVTGWLFTNQGTTICSIVGGAIMALLAYLTKGFDSYSPASYGAAFLFGAIAILIAIRLMASSYLAITRNLRTKDETFIEYGVDNNHADITASANIYKGPLTTVTGVTLIQVNAGPAPKKNRSHPQIPHGQDHLPSAQSAAPDNGGSLDFVILFDRPIANVKLPKVTKKTGHTPKVLNCVMDERWCKFTLAEIKNGAVFRVDFNHTT
jgi:hypothetical protein